MKEDDSSSSDDEEFNKQDMENKLAAGGTSIFRDILAQSAYSITKKKSKKNKSRTCEKSRAPTEKKGKIAIAIPELQHLSKSNTEKRNQESVEPKDSLKILKDWVALGIVPEEMLQQYFQDSKEDKNLLRIKVNDCKAQSFSTKDIDQIPDPFSRNKVTFADDLASHGKHHGFVSKKVTFDIDKQNNMQSELQRIQAKIPTDVKQNEDLPNTKVTENGTSEKTKSEKSTSLKPRVTLKIPSEPLIHQYEKLKEWIITGLVPPDLAPQTLPASILRDWIELGIIPNESHSDHKTPSTKNSGPRIKPWDTKEIKPEQRLQDWVTKGIVSVKFAQETMENLNEPNVDEFVDADCTIKTSLSPNSRVTFNSDPGRVFKVENDFSQDFMSPSSMPPFPPENAKFSSKCDPNPGLKVEYESVKIPKPMNNQELNQTQMLEYWVAKGIIPPEIAQETIKALQQPKPNDFFEDDCGSELKTENESNKTKALEICSVCQIKQANSCLLMCGHIVHCFDCATKKMCGLQLYKCPTCEQKVCDVIKIAQD